MKVLLVSEPGVDGVFRYVEALAHYLVAQGVRVHLAYSNRRGSDRLGRLIEFVGDNGGATLNLATGNRPALSDLRALAALYLFVRRVKPDIIHSHSSKAGGLARLLGAMGIRAQQVYHPHAYSGMQPRSGLARLVYDGIERCLGPRGLTINCSEDEQTFAREQLRLSINRLNFIPNGIDTRHFSPPAAAQKYSLRQTLGLPPDALVLGAMARTAPQKDPMTLYHAFAEALRRDPQLVLYHIGRGEMDEEIRTFVANAGVGHRIVRRDYLATPVDFYRAVDGFVLTSIYEGMSLAVLEAMACDLPLILSDAPGNREFARLPLSHLHTAPIRDSSAFADAIVRWAAERRAGERTSNHRALAVERFDSRVCFARVLELYRQAAKEKRRRRPRGRAPRRANAEYQADEYARRPAPHR